MLSKTDRFLLSCRHDPASLEQHSDLYYDELLYWCADERAVTARRVRDW